MKLLKETTNVSFSRFMLLQTLFECKNLLDVNVKKIIKDLN